VHLRTILVKWPTWRTISSIMFIWILYMFRATLCSSSGGQLYEYNFWYNYCVLVAVRYAGWGPEYRTATTQRVIIPDVVSIQLSSWRWAQSCSKHVEDSNKHIIEETVRYVGYLPELYEEARSEKYKISNIIYRSQWIPTKNKYSALPTVG